MRYNSVAREYSQAIPDDIKKFTLSK